MNNLDRHRAHVNKASRIYVARHPERRRAIMRAWYAKNPWASAHHSMLRRGRMAEVVCDELGVKNLIRQWRSRRWLVCYYCGVKITQEQVHVDHIVPVSKGGPHIPGNLCTSCERCNLSKKDKLLGTWKQRGQQVLPL
jgi:5-methylcytosine-specific restriction endonuclease McrA